MEIGSSTSLNTTALPRPESQTSSPPQRSLNEDTPAQVTINNEQSRPNATQSIRASENQETLNAARQEASERRRSEAPADQLSKRIDDIVGNKVTLNSEIDELV